MEEQTIINSLLETNLKCKILIAKTLITNLDTNLKTIL